MILTAKAKYWKKNLFQCHFVERERDVSCSGRAGEEREKARQERE
jgi:hypothetical protein